MRYLPLDAADRRHMLGVIGAAGIDDLFADVPAPARLSAPVDLPYHAGEIEVERELSALAALNRPAGAGPFFCGAGAYRHQVPATVDHIIQRSEFLTSYTPYQPEIAQGTLQVLFEFQTQVAALLGMEVANASLYDGSTACAEAVMMARRITRRRKAVLSGGLHPHYAAVTGTIDTVFFWACFFWAGPGHRDGSGRNIHGRNPDRTRCLRLCRTDGGHHVLLEADRRRQCHAQQRDDVTAADRAD